MTAAARLLRQARRGHSLTQRQLADRLKLRQPALASVESGAHDPGSDRLERLVAAAGHRLAVLPTRAHTVADIADAIYVALRNGDKERAFRLLVQLNDDLASESGAIRVALTVTPPAPVGDVRYDAYVAAIVEHYLTKDRLPVPDWVQRPDRVLAEPWRLDRTAGPELEAATPPAFCRHGVFIDEAELVSA
jgi:transcriptional regulator with XRE-family HTH domain